MEVRVLLIDLGVYQAAQITNLEPLGISYIGAWLRQHGHDVRVLHMLGMSFGDALAVIREYRPTIVGISVYSSNYAVSRDLAEVIKRAHDCVMVFGGIHATIEPGIVREGCIDIAVLGEGEATMLELCHALRDGRTDHDGIAGLAFERDGEVVQTARRERIEDLDALPMPLREGLPMALYKSIVPTPVLHRQRGASINTSRGCQYDCSFCTTPHAWNGRRISRSVDNVIAEIELLVRDYGVNSLYFRDEDLSFDRRWLRTFCTAIIERGIEISWYCFSRITSVNEELLLLMERAGCTAIGFGIESPDAESLERIGKRTKVEQVRHIIGFMKGLKTWSIGFLMVGLPWQDRESILRAFEEVEAMNLDIVFVSYATPFKHTRLHEEAESKGLIRVFDTNRYTNFDVVMDTEHLTAAEVEQVRSEVVRSYYLRPRYVASLARRLVQQPSLGLSLAEAAVLKLRARV